MKNFIKKHLVYVLILSGILFFAYNEFFYFPFAQPYHYNYRGQMKFFAIVLIILGIVIDIKRDSSIANGLNKESKNSLSILLILIIIANLLIVNGLSNIESVITDGVDELGRVNNNINEIDKDINSMRLTMEKP